MLLEGTPKVHRTFDEQSATHVVWISVLVEHVQKRLEGLVNMPIAVAVRDENGNPMNKALRFTTYSTVLAFTSEEDADLIASNLAKALETEVDYTEVEPPDEEFHYS